jgi:hypothetical protein
MSPFKSFNMEGLELDYNVTDEMSNTLDEIFRKICQRQTDPQVRPSGLVSILMNHIFGQI